MNEIIETTEETFDFPEIPEIIEPVNQFYVELNEENRITGVQSTKVNDNMFLFDFPVGFDISNHQNYKIIDGELVFDEFIYPEIEVQPTEEQLRITALEEALLVTDETAIELYENQMAQEEVNLAQDEALIELYEMVGGE